jgi:hypothetical protein
LEKQLGGIRNEDLRNLRLVVAQTTFELGGSQVGDTLHTAAKISEVSNPMDDSGVV